LIKTLKALAQLGLVNTQTIGRAVAAMNLRRPAAAWTVHCGKL
jgi:hypothetical protein